MKRADPSQLELIPVIQTVPPPFQFQTSYNCVVKWHDKCDDKKCQCQCHFILMKNGKWRRKSKTATEEEMERVLKWWDQTVCSDDPLT